MSHVELLKVIRDLVISHRRDLVMGWNTIDLTDQYESERAERIAREIKTYELAEKLLTIEIQHALALAGNV